jgi:hypothetical protein
MRFLGIILAFIVTIVLASIYNWLILLGFILFPIIVRKVSQPYFMCPNCNHIQSNRIILSEDTKSRMVHGRRTKSGYADQRYNTRYIYTKIIDFGVCCEKCSNTYKVNRIF